MSIPISFPARTLLVASNPPMYEYREADKAPSGPCQQQQQQQQRRDNRDKLNGKGNATRYTPYKLDHAPLESHRASSSSSNEWKQEVESSQTPTQQAATEQYLQCTRGGVEPKNRGNHSLFLIFTHLGPTKPKLQQLFV